MKGKKPMNSIKGAELRYSEQVPTKKNSGVDQVVRNTNESAKVSQRRRPQAAREL